MGCHRAITSSTFFGDELPCVRRGRGRERERERERDRAACPAVVGHGATGMAMDCTQAYRFVQVSFFRARRTKPLQAFKLTHPTAVGERTRERMNLKKCSS